jgi:ABC-type multidrug transport system fused ATPase/permease subunit
MSADPARRPLDPRLLRHAATARRFLLAGVGIAVGAALLLMAQAQLLATVVAAGFLQGAGLAALLPLLGLAALAVVGRAGLAWAGELAAFRASADVVRELRSRVVGHVLRLGPRHAGGQGQVGRAAHQAAVFCRPALATGATRPARWCVLAYEAWTYHVFRARLRGERPVPEPPVAPVDPG